MANEVDPVLVKFGGGAKDLELRPLETAAGPMLICHLLVDCRDAMGANAVNTMAEAIAPHIEKKQTLQPDWPSFTTPRGKAIQYGAAACPRTLEVYSRYVGIPMDPKFTDQDVADIVAAVRKVYPAVMKT